MLFPLVVGLERSPFLECDKLKVVLEGTLARGTTEVLPEVAACILTIAFQGKKQNGGFWVCFQGGDALAKKNAYMQTTASIKQRKSSFPFVREGGGYAMEGPPICKKS